jgi:hypothetical protein
MARLGHSSTRAAMICQHATSDGDQAIAKALGRRARRANQLAKAVPEAEKRMTSGPCVAHRPAGSPPAPSHGRTTGHLTWRFGLERAKGIEPS